jgi:hypothetical protein
VRIAALAVRLLAGSVKVFQQSAAVLLSSTTAAVGES